MLSCASLLLNLTQIPHPVLVLQGEGDGAGLLNKREAARLQRIREREHKRGIGPAPTETAP